MSSSPNSSSIVRGTHLTQLRELGIPWAYPRSIPPKPWGNR
jgi:hypothetical protein